jgi:hypothetical protein
MAGEVRQVERQRGADGGDDQQRKDEEGESVLAAKRLHGSIPCPGSSLLLTRAAGAWRG